MQRLGGPLVVGVGIILVLAVCAGLVFFVAIQNNRGSTSLDFQDLTQDSPTIAHPHGLEIGVVPRLLTSELAIAISNISRGDFHGGQAGEEWETLRENLPPYLNPADFVYMLAVQGTAPPELTLTLNVPDGTLLDTLDMYAWDGEQWYFIPSQIEGGRALATVSLIPRAIALMQTAPVVPVSATVFDLGDTLGDVGSALNGVQPTGLFLQANGALVGEITGGWVFGAGYAVTPIVTNSANAEGSAALNDMLSNPDARATQIGGVVDLVVNGGYNGVVLAYQSLDPARGPAYTLFLETLAAELHTKNKSLAVVIPLPTLVENLLDTHGYALASIGAVADSVEIDLGNEPYAFGDGTAHQILARITDRVNRYKLRMVTSSLSTDSSNGANAYLSMAEALAPLGDAVLSSDPVGLVAGQEVTVSLDGSASLLSYDELAFTPKFEYVDAAGASHTLFYATPGMLAAHLDIAQNLYLGGVTVRDLFDPGSPPGMLDALIQYKVSASAVAAVTNPAIVWTISDGTSVVAQGNGSPEEPFAWLAPGAGEYSIAAALRIGHEAALNGFSVEIAAQPEPESDDTATPTSAPALPTATPCPADCPTPVPVPTATPAPTSAPAIVASGSWGTFELGGQVVHGGIAASNEMKQAGMTWVKLQAHYPHDATADINNAHALGFKILLSSIGDRSRAHDPAHQAEYAAWLGTLAAKGADAIEVWNEMNLTREWPDGQIGPASYINMLQSAYGAIKAANPNTLVISGALAPTGFFNGCHAHGCDDKPYLEGLVALGGANYLDCVGIHYNEGIVSPTAFGGGADPRDDHYTRYFYGMIETYSAIFGGQRQMCFTELGYLSGEEWGFLPAAFMWKPPYNNTVAEQAQYLAEAASLSQADGRIRMIIIFNVDFTHFSDDPQAGYAMVRPNGQCPSCVTLESVMP